MQIYLRLPRRSIFGVSQSSVKPSAMQIYLQLPRRSIFGVSQSSIKPSAMQIYLRLPRRSIFGVSQSSVKPSAMQIYLRLLRRSIFGVSQSTIKPNTMQTLFAFYGAPYLRRSQRYAFNEKKTTVRRTNYQQSVDRSRLRIVWQYFWIYRRKSLSFVQPKSTELWITMKNWW